MPEALEHFDPARPLWDSRATPQGRTETLCGARRHIQIAIADEDIRDYPVVKLRECTMSDKRKWAAGSSRRKFLMAAAGVTAGTVLPRQSLRAQGIRAGAAAQPDLALAKIDAQLMITPEQAWDWNMFKARGGPTYAGSAGWKRYTDFLIAKMQEFGAVDLDYVEIPYDHYIVDDWPDRRTHIHDTGVALEKLVTDGTPVPVVASYAMTSGFTPPQGVTAPMLYYAPAHPPARSLRKFSSSRPRPIRSRRTPMRSWITTR